MRHDLLGYLLGALDGCEHDTIRQQLTVDAELRRELAELQQRLAVLEQRRVSYEPPAHLSDSTCRLIAKHIAESCAAVAAQQESEGRYVTGGRAAAVMSPATDRAGTAREWSLVDLVIAAGITIAAAFLFFPSIINGRNQSVVQMCQNNQRLIGRGMIDYSSLHGSLPTPQGKGLSELMGMLPMTLAKEQFIPSECLICPGAGRSQRAAIGGPEMPPLPQENIARVAAFLNAGYCYPLGYVNNGQYVPRRTSGKAHLALLSDLPSSDRNGLGFGRHANNKVNVVFDDLHIAELVGGQVLNPDLQYDDQIFENDSGETGPGLHPDDAVLLPGMTRPNWTSVRVRIDLNGFRGDFDQLDTLFESRSR